MNLSKKGILIIIAYIVAMGIFFNKGWSKEKGLVCYLKFDEGKSDTVKDGSGEGNDGQIDGEPKWVKGVSGSALEFNGVDNWVNVENDPIESAAPFSVSVWVNPLEYKKTAWEIKIVQQRLPVTSWSLYQYERNVSLVLWHADKVAYTAEAKNALTVDEWVHIVGIFDGKNVKIFVNGELKGSKEVADSVIESTGGIQIGWDGTAKDREFHGKIDEVRIYNRAISNEEVKVIYNNVKQ